MKNKIQQKIYSIFQTLKSYASKLRISPFIGGHLKDKKDKYFIESHMGLNNVRTTMMITFFFGILLYHLTNYITMDNSDLQSIYKISSFVIAVLFFVTVSHAEIFMRIFIPNKFIGGTFFGTMTNKKSKEVLKIRLKIKQNLLQTFADGELIDKNNKIIECVDGFIIKERIHADLNSYFFIFINDDNEKKMMKINVRNIKDIKQKHLLGTYWDLSNNTSYQIDINRKMENVFGHKLKQ